MSPFVCGNCMRLVASKHERFEINIAALSTDGKNRPRQTKITDACKDCYDAVIDRLVGKAKSSEQGSLL